MRIQSVGMPGLGIEIAILDGDPARRRTVAGYTRPGADGAPILVGAVALDSPRPLLGYRDLIGHPVATVPVRRRAACCPRCRTPQAPPAPCSRGPAAPCRGSTSCHRLAAGSAVTRAGTL